MDSQVIETLVSKYPILSAAAGLWGATMITYFTRDLPASFYRKIRRQFLTSIVVTSDEEEFYALARWLEEKQISRKSRSLRIKRGSISVGYGAQIFLYSGRICWCIRDRVDTKSEMIDDLVIQAIGRDQEFLRGLVREAVKKTEADDLTKIYVPRHSRWWKLTSQTKRGLDSVFLSDSNRNAIVHHLSHFLGSRDWYRAAGVPYRTGVCLYGPPGTGKTSLARAICAEYGLDLYILDITQFNDADLKEQVWSIGPNSVLLLEDIDTVSTTHERDGSEKETAGKVTLGGLLNAIDGVVDSNGRVLILTTNHPERLDPALLRPGRIDLKLELSYMDAQMLRSAIRRSFPNFSIPEPLYIRSRVTPAEVQAAIFSHQNDPRAVLRSMCLHEPNVAAAQLGGT